MLRFYRTLAWCVIAFVVAQGGLAQEIGERVVVIGKAAAIDAPGRDPIPLEPGTVLEVRGVRGQWLRVDEPENGWVIRKDVLPIGNAEAHLVKKTSDPSVEFSDFHALAQFRGNERGWAEAVAVYNLALKTFPESALAHFHRGMARSKLGQTKEAIADYEEALTLDSSMAAAMNNLAWILATGEKEFRDGERAVALATKARELTGDQDSAILDTLAAALAETGKFREATQWQLAAIRLKGRGEDVDDLYERLRLYSSNQPYRARVKPSVEK